MRFIEAVPPRRARGRVALIYGQIRHDFALLRDPYGNSPFLAHSPHPELLAGFWSLIYETLLVDGAVRRADKEAIAASVSRVNDCPFCTEAHALLSGVAGTRGDRLALSDGAVELIGDKRTRELVAWAAATRQPGSELLRHPPFGPEEAPEVLGTALAFHYVNRIVEVFQGHGPMNAGPAPVRGLAVALIGRVAGRALRRRREPGRTLVLLPEAPLPDDLSWADPAPALASAIARFAAAVQRAGAEALSEQARGRVSSLLAAWEGADPPLYGSWLEDALQELEPAPLAETRLAVLAALAPHRIDEAVVESFRRVRPSDGDLVAAVAGSALRAARGVGQWWLAPAAPRSAAA